VLTNVLFAPAPTSGTSCNGAYNGTFVGNITVSAGQDCIFVNGSVNGNVHINGGNLTLVHSQVAGNVHVNGGGTFTIGPDSTIGGNLQIENLPSGSAQNQICGTNVQGNLHFQNNGTAVVIGSPTCPGNTIGGNLQVTDNTASTQVLGNTVSGNLHVQNNSAATQVVNNTVSGNLRIDNNTSSTAVFSNNVNGNLQCSGNNPSLITGGGNTANSKRGQCSAF
jgi:hypothetical protein